MNRKKRPSSKRVFVHLLNTTFVTLSLSFATAAMAEGVALAWNSVEYAQKYKLERADGTIAEGGAFSTVFADILETAFTDTSVVEGDTYTYRVVGCIDNPNTGETLCESVAEYSTHAEATAGEVVPMLWAEKGGAVSSHTLPAVSVASNFNGAIPGEAGVSGGAANYYIPVVVPPGRNGMQPDISLNYSSRSGLGVVGVGWRLDAGSSISRCPRTAAQDDGVNGAINYDANDRLCLDGQRLVALSGNYAQSGTTYTTEIDSFITVTQSGALNASGVSFNVELPNGSIRTYGVSASNRVVPTNKTQALTWLIDQETDLAGNTITYQYTADQSHGEVLLDKIVYTGKGSDLGDREVRFTYESAEYYGTQYLAGGKTRTTKRLQKIATYYANQAVRDYTLDYQLSGASGRPLLTDVTECGRDGTDLCRIASSFDWSDDAPTFKTQIMATEDGTEVFPQESYVAGGQTAYTPASLDNVTVAYDIDGNGVRDWVYHQPNATDTITYVNAEGEMLNQFDYEFERPCTLDPWTHSRVCVEADFDVDGRADLIQISDNGQVSLGYVLDYNQVEVRSTGLDIDAIGDSDIAVIVHAGDYNGDGLPDLIVKQGTSTQYTLNLYLHQGTRTNAFNGAPVALITINGSQQSSGYVAFARDVQFVGDMNGDGLGDFSIYGQHTNRYLPNLLELLLTDTSGSQISLTSHDIYFNYNGQAITSSETVPIDDGVDVTVTRRSLRDYSTLIDVNGDGLADWVGYLDNFGNTNLYAKLNMGDGQFDTAIDLGLALPERNIMMPDSTPEEPEYGIEPTYKDAFQQIDIDGDGKTELIMPDYVVQAACTTFLKWISTTSWGPETRCGASVADAYPSGQYSEDTLSPDVDRNIYQFKALKFTEDATGNISARFVTKTDMPSMDLLGTRSTNLLVDAFGKGLQDMVFSYGCENPISNVNGVWTEVCSMDAGSASGVFNNNLNKVFISKNYGATSKLDPDDDDYHPIDMLIAAQNGLGKDNNWTYLPLSSGQEGVDFYDPARQDFADNEHFNFASSMYVVSRFDTSNGIGLQNESRYQYTGAVYNNQGRGFRGFKTIVEQNFYRDHYPESESNIYDTASYTQFGQKFPQSSLVEVQTQFASTSVSDWACQTASASCPIISTSSHDWVDNPQHNITGVELQFNQQSVTRTYDINNYAPISTQTRTVASTDVDEFNNVEEQTTTVTDAFGTYSTTQYGTYNNATRSWPGRYDDKTAVKHTVTGRGITVTSGTDNDKVVRTEVLWNTDLRKPQTVTVKHGDSAGTGNESTATQTATVTTTEYNGYGLPEQVDVVGQVYNGSSSTGTTQTRTVTTSYSKNGMAVSADGYFPYQITQENGAYDHITTSQTDPMTGLPTQVTDVSDVVTATTYDALARPVSITQSGYPTQHIGYQNDDTDAPSYSVMQIVTKQAGVPDSIEYKDLLGRTLRSATEHFDGSGEIFVDTHYNARGLMAGETAPYLKGGTTYTTTYSGFDALGRATSKVSPQTNGQLSTTYTYEGLTTTIDVVPTSGHTLQMQRVYNSLEQLMRTQDANGKLTEYAYDGSGNPIVIKDANGNSIIAQYDALGRKEYVDDPNQGRTDFSYNDFGELESETDANGDSIYYDMDLLGRVTNRSGDNGAAASFEWDTDTRGLLTSQSVNGHSTAYDYDSAARLTDTRVTIGTDTYVTTTTYDSNFGRPIAMTYPAVGNQTNGLTVEYLYNSAGYLTTERNAQSQYVYRSISAQDALGNITSASLNDDTLTGTYTYHQASGQMLSTLAGDYHHLQYTEYDSYGNLKTQQNHGLNQTGIEEYEYDTLHRLTKSTLSGSGISATIQYAYDNVGNIKKKTDHSTDNNGAYSYAVGTNKLQSVALKGGGSDTFGYDDKGNQTHRNGQPEMLYNVFNKPTSITKQGSDINLQYGADLARYQQTRVVNNQTTTTFYIGKHFEVEDTDGSKTYKHYLSDVAIITEYDSGAANILYTHRDRLGSAATMTDENNGIRSLRFYDPFGKPRNGDWSVMSNAQIALNMFDTRYDIRRGFTDHEHLDEAELIHMNGRVYDYNLGRFMSVDPFIQEPGNSQSINPYSYIMNNPLAGTDPSGYVAEKDVDKQPSKLDKLRNKNTSATSNIDSGFVTGVSSDNGADSDTKTMPTDEAKTQDKMAQGDTNGQQQPATVSFQGTANEVKNQIQDYLVEQNCGSGCAIAFVAAEVVYVAFLEDGAMAIDEIRQGNVGNTIGAVFRAVAKPVKAISLIWKKQIRKNPCNNSCFVAGTLVLTRDGYKSIEEVEKGDQVLATDVASGEQDWKDVIATWIVYEKDIYLVTITNETGETQTIEATSNHPFYVLGSGWVDTIFLDPGDTLIDEDDGQLKVESVVYQNRKDTAYNFTVADFHTYYVTEKNVLVHNCGDEFKGGAHREMTKPRGDGLDSHHMPARQSNPSVHPNDGPAIKMHPHDHHLTSSNGRNGRAGAIYRAEIARMIESGNMRDAMAKEIRDVRRASLEGSGSRTKYNKAIRQMLDYSREQGMLNK